MQVAIKAMATLSDKELWAFDARERIDLVEYARDRLAYQCRQRGDNSETVARAARVLDPQALTLGFARRFASYKRPNLLLKDPERLIKILTNTDRPGQIIVAGKAHPHDENGKHFVQQWAQFVRRPEVRHHAVFLEDYDMALAQELVQGVDVWINTPRRPWEACGTSGMKVLVNGGLNLLVLDGWWAEAYQPDVGWALGDDGEHGPEQDAEDAEALYSLLEDEIVPLFYDRDASDLPCGWIARMRTSLALLAPRFSANRMVSEYVEKLYLPAARDYQQRSGQGIALIAWEESLRRSWENIRWGRRTVRLEKGKRIFEIEADLGGLAEDSVLVQLYADGEAGGEPVCLPLIRKEAVDGETNCYRYACSLDENRPQCDFTARIIPYHPFVRVPAELSLIHWEDDRSC